MSFIQIRYQVNIPRRAEDGGPDNWEPVDYSFDDLASLWEFYDRELKGQPDVRNIEVSLNHFRTAIPISVCSNEYTQDLLTKLQHMLDRSVVTIERHTKKTDFLLTHLPEVINGINRDFPGATIKKVSNSQNEIVVEIESADGRMFTRRAQWCVSHEDGHLSVWTL